MATYLGCYVYLIPFQFTVADLVLYVYVESINAHKMPADGPPLLASFPRLLENRQYVEKIPRVAAYLATRPDTPF